MAPVVGFVIKPSFAFLVWPWYKGWMDKASFIPELPEAVRHAPEHIRAMYAMTIEHASPVVKAALEVAQLSYARHPDKIKYRGAKENGAQIPAITHPIMVVKLLEKLGQGEDSLAIAVALLHDVLEDDPNYKQNPEQLKTDLQAAILRQKSNRMTQKEAADVTAKVAEYCVALCNPEKMGEGKFVHQVERMRHISPRGQLIKVLDQTASLMEDIWFASKRSPEQQWDFAVKGLSVARAASLQDGATAQAASLYELVFRQFRKILAEKDDNKVDALRKEFEPDKGLIDDAKKLMREQIVARNMLILYPDSFGQTGLSHIPHPAYQKGSSSLGFGCAGVTLNKEGAVHSYRLVICPADSPFDPKNKAAHYLLGELITDERRIDVGNSYLQGERQMVREYQLNPPVPLEVFQKKAKDASGKLNKFLGGTGAEPLNIIDKRMTRILENKAEEILSEQGVASGRPPLPLR